MKAYLSETNIGTIVYVSTEENAISDINTQYHERAKVPVQPRGERYIASRLVEFNSVETMSKDAFNGLVYECQYDCEAVHTGGLAVLAGNKEIIGYHKDNKYYSNSK